MTIGKIFTVSVVAISGFISLRATPSYSVSQPNGSYVQVSAVNHENVSYNCNIQFTYSYRDFPDEPIKSDSVNANPSVGAGAAGVIYTSPSKVDFMLTSEVKVLFTQSGPVPIPPGALKIGLVNRVVMIWRGNQLVVQDHTGDDLHDSLIDQGSMVVAVRCGKNNGGDGVLIYGLYQSNGQIKCDGVVRFVPADSFLTLESASGGVVHVRTGKNRDVYTSFGWSGQQWNVITDWGQGYLSPTVPMPKNVGVWTAPTNHDPHYLAVYQNLR